MYANVQWRHNPATGEEAPYYRLKESYRDACGTVHSLVVLNIGFEPALVPRQMRRIAAALTSRFAHRHQKDAFGGPLEGLDPAERDYAERYWRQMITDGQIDRFDNREEERHLCSVTDDLFNQKNRIVLFDLTNFYFEGSKRGSKKAKFGRSKEKRSDCKLLVLALCVNTASFPRYSEILEGNTPDPKSLPEMVKRLSEKAAKSTGSSATRRLRSGK